MIERAEALGLKGHTVFGGRVPEEPKGPIERAMAENIPPEFRDRRNWDEIRDWATQVAGEIAQLGSNATTVLSGSSDVGDV